MLFNFFIPRERASSKHRVDFFYFLADFFCPTSADRSFFSLIYWVFVEECVSSPLCVSAAVSVTSNPGKTKKQSVMCISVNWNPPVTTLTSFLQIQWLLLPRSLLVSHPAAQNQCEVLREGCCRWNAAVFFFFSFLWFVVLLPVQFKAQVSRYRLWNVQSRTRRHQYWPWVGLSGPTVNFSTVRSSVEESALLWCSVNFIWRVFCPETADWWMVLTSNTKETTWSLTGFFSTVLQWKPKRPRWWFCRFSPLISLTFCR